ncbi:hypothetical protein Psch_03060 [Pelotomaculum schinkii]|uniref:Uncharacterized protein n=1 Tax=Pelotomaculum schinkii TaxID=78350 RepID=A0A4Y7RAL1_9FIRM|nr:hypothetical protein [Pelotomaculum schinkii]TEB06018.1 hypothetical protein Psch_03060 [Pelotomaculum schinkii]
MKNKKIVIAVSCLVAIFIIGSGLFIYRTITSVSEMFRLNGQLQAEGYFMGEFEFKILGCAYFLDKGKYITAFTKLNELHRQLKTREGLIRVPDFADKNEEMDFYLSLQNPKTGAFMDETYPSFYYFEPTLNIVEHLELLAEETGRPLRLKYPLRFLDEINNPERLKNILDDLSTVGWIGSKLPKTNYIMASFYHNYDLLERNKLYSFSPEWKATLLQWFYLNQDSKTGFWGPRLRNSGEMLHGGDLGPTYKIAGLFVDEKGNNLHQEFPLRYKDEMLKTTLEKISEPMPEDASLAELHDWELTRTQGIKLLTNYLWNGIFLENKNAARTFMENIVKNKYEACYLEEQGAFSYYPGAKDATLDGTGSAMSLLDVVGALSQEQQRLLWGTPEQNITDLGSHEVKEFKESDLAALKSFPNLNSLRYYLSDPDYNDFTKGVVCIDYPQETWVIDVMELLPRVRQWVNTTPQSMGNWVSKQAIIQKAESVQINSIPVNGKALPVNLFLNEVLRNNNEFVVVGFDVLQVPICKIKFIKCPN